MATKQVGFLVATTDNDWKRYIAWFKQALKTPNAVISYHPPGGARGDAAAILETAAYLANHVDVIVTAGTGPARALKTATQTIKTPFVFAAAGDPAITGLTPQPGGNFTGCSNQQVSLVTERVRYMLSKPAFKDPIAVVGNYYDEPTSTAMSAAHTVLLAQRRDVHLASIAPGDNIETFIGHLKDRGVLSLYVCSDPYLTTYSKDLNKAAHKAKMRTMFEFEEHKLGHGGDDYYGVDFKDLFETAADYVDQILSGKKKAGDLPIYITSKHAGSAKASVKDDDGRAPPAKKRAAAPAKRKSRRTR